MEADIAAVLDESDQEEADIDGLIGLDDGGWTEDREEPGNHNETIDRLLGDVGELDDLEDVINTCLLYTSPSPRDGLLSRMPSSA